MLPELQKLGFEPKWGPEPKHRVLELERLIGVSLPAEYREFLLRTGGGYVEDCVADCTESTPFGEHIITRLHPAESVIDLLDSEVSPRNMVCIGSGHLGRMTCLSVAGLDHGQIFSLDTEMRFFWTQETLSKLPDLDQSIREFFRLRDEQELSGRPWGYENCYHVADSFTAFLQKLRPSS